MPEWVDFKTVKKLATFPEVLARYNIRLRTVNTEYLRGRCPLPTHSSKESKESFTVNVLRNIWSCKSESCIKASSRKGGNILDFVMVMEKVPLPDAARKLHEWFGAKEGVPSNGSAPSNGNAKPAIQPVPESFVKQMPFMQQVEQWFGELIKLRDNEDDGEYHKRVLAGVKLKILESYRNGKTAAAPSAN